MNIKKIIIVICLFNQGAVVANFNFSTKYDSNLYKTYYQSALKLIHSDFENTIRYGVVLDRNLWLQLINLNKKQKSTPKIALFTQFGTIKVNLIQILN